MFEEIEKRIAGLDEWLNPQGVKEEQAHLIKDSKERLYWHYGYCVALKDVLALLKKETTIPS